MRTAPTLSEEQSAHAAATHRDLEPFAGARAISDPADGLDRPAPRFSRAFELPRGIRSARLRVSARGVHDTRLNGERAGEQVLSPEWTEYSHRTFYDDIDVTRMLRPGRNRIEITVGNGWYRGKLGRPARRDLYGSTLAAIARLEVELVDGSTMAVCTDEDWSVVDSEIVANDLYDGCTIDLRGSRARTAVRAAVASPPTTTAFGERAHPPIAVTETRAVDLTAREDGSLLVDTRQNLVGWLRIRVRGATAGQHVVVRHAEVLTPDAQLALAPLRDARARDEYVLDDAQTVDLEPSFTFHGFRYALVTGLAPSQIVAVEAVVVGSALRRTAWLETSHPGLNRLHENAVWSMRGNFVGLPTDCPQRDERLGWTADIQVFAPTALALFDSATMLASWLQDLRTAQRADGSVPVVVPDIYRRESVATAGWGDAAVVVPWQIYQHTGDAGVLAASYESMRGWISRVRRDLAGDGIWRGGHQYGDWLDPSAPPDDPAAAMTDPDFVATACHIRSLDIVARTAATLGRDDDAREYAGLARRARADLQRAFVTPSGRLVPDTQAGYALALVYDLLQPDQREAAGDRLADLVRLNGFTIGTGFLATPVVLDALVSTGHERVAERLLTQTEPPSWLYAVEMGATTIWERWDSLLPDGSVNPGEMTSFNHYALGAVADWMHRHLGGVRRTSPGWRRFRVSPPIASGIDHAGFVLESPRGRIRSRWRRRGDVVDLEVEVPAGSVADLEIDGHPEALPPGTHRISIPAPLPPPSAPATVRAAMDDAALWAQVVDRVHHHRPHWSARAIAAKAAPYLDRPLPAIARIVGLSIPTSEEAALAAALGSLTPSRSIDYGVTHEH